MDRCLLLETSLVVIFHTWNLPREKSVCVCVLSPIQLFASPWTIACQAPLSMGFFQARILEWVAIPFSRGSS